jgi:hypothetical protein
MSESGEGFVKISPLTLLMDVAFSADRSVRSDMRDSRVQAVIRPSIPTTLPTNVYEM